MDTGSIAPWQAAVVVFIVIAIIVILERRKKKKQERASYKDIDLAIPPTRRGDLLYGYYSSILGTYEAVKDHVNLFWHSKFFPDEVFIEILKKTTHAVVFDVASYLTTREETTPWYKKLLIKLKVLKDKSRSFTSVFHVEGEEHLRQFFLHLRAEGVLTKITYLYPKDEPNLFMKNASEHLKVIQATKRLRDEFQELAHVRLACIYGRGKPFWNIEEYDVVGVDDYDQKSECLTIGEHARLLKAKQPHQRTMLVPGPAFGHNPAPWIAYALLNAEEVEMVIPFLWFDDPNHKDVAYTGLEAASEDFKKLWIEAADIALNKA